VRRDILGTEAGDVKMARLQKEEYMVRTVKTGDTVC
jgi:hypothetical protein